MSTTDQAGAPGSVVRCPRCYGSGQEPLYGPSFDRDGDVRPIGYVPCGICRGATQILAPLSRPRPDRPGAGGKT